MPSICDVTSEAVEPTKYPLVFVAGVGDTPWGSKYFSEGRMFAGDPPDDRLNSGAFFGVGDELGGSCVACKDRAEYAALADTLGPSLLQACGPLQTGDPYGICCGGADKPSVYLAATIPYAPSSVSSVCLDVHVKLARALFVNDRNDEDHDGLADKANIIGHSLGGVDAMVLANDASRAEQVASITAVGSPVGGSPVAAQGLRWANALAGHGPNPAQCEQAKSERLLEAQLASVLRAFGAARLRTVESVVTSVGRMGYSPSSTKMNMLTAIAQMAGATEIQFSPHIFYQTFAGYALPTEDEVRWAVALNHTWDEYIPLSTLVQIATSAGPELSEGAIKGFVESYLSEIDNTCRGVYPYTLPAGKKELVDVQPTEWNKLPTLMKALHVLWLVASKAKPNELPVPSDGLVPVASQILGETLPMQFSPATQGLQQAMDPIRAGVFFRGCLPAHHGAQCGRYDMERDHLSTPLQTNPCTGWNHICFYKHVVQDLHMRGF